MQTESMFSIIIVISAGILTILNLIDKIAGYYHKAKQPTTNLDVRVTEIERKMIVFEERFGRDKSRLDSFEEGNRVILKSLLAIMKHDLDGNNTEALKDASDDLQEYMIHKR